jgi:DNA processing protein
VSSAACTACLRRSGLIAYLAPALARVLERRERRRGGILGLAEADFIAAVSGDRAEDARRFLEDFDPARELERLTGAGVSAVCRHSGLYPARLLELPDAPAVIYFTGAQHRLAELAAHPVVTIVGARRASPYALEVAHELGRALAAAEVAVVSGLALGVDSAAHRGALEGGGRAVAVLGCGPDVVYPARHRALYERVRAGGVVLSELPPGQPAFRWSFPARNRIMAGLGEMTVVVEAGDPSGSLITAAFARELNRSVGAVPGRVTARVAAGSNRLLSEGARVVRGARDVLEELFGAGAAETFEGNGGAPRARLEPRLRHVLDLVEAGETVSAIGRSVRIPAGEVRAALGALESLGLIVRDPLGGCRRRARS